MRHDDLIASLFFQAYALCRQTGDDHAKALENAKEVADEGKKYLETTTP